MVGNKIKEYLRENGITQTFVAQKAGISNNAMSHICNKDRSIDCIEYYKICKALNVPLDYFLQDVEL